MSRPRGRAHRILPFSARTHATVSIRTVTIAPGFCWPRDQRREWSGRFPGLQLPDHVQCVTDVLADAGHGVEAVADRALAVDHVGDPAGQQPEHRRNPVELAYSATLIAEQRERQLMPAGEGGVPADRVRTDPDHLRAGLGEHLVAIAEGARLRGTAA